MKTQNTTTKTNNHTIVDNYQITPIIDEITLYRQWKPHTRTVYHQTLHQYCALHNMSFTALIYEAEEDEEDIHKVNKRRIKKRLQAYVLQLYDEGKQPRTVQVYISRILSLYRYYDIETPRLHLAPVVNTEHYEDLPTVDEIRYVLMHTDTKSRAVITALASSGMRVSDLGQLTVGDFFTACREYVDTPRGIRDFLTQLRDSSDFILPTLRIPNQKTGNPYITFFSDEATRYIVEYLLEYMKREMISTEDRLFHMLSHSMTVKFARIGDRLGLGRLETRGKFHPHALRKFFATTLTNNGCDFLSVEFMLGHKLDTIREAYYKADPERLRLKYREYVDHLTFMGDVSVRDLSSSELQELQELRDFKRDSVERIRHLEEMMTLMNEKI